MAAEPIIRQVRRENPRAFIVSYVGVAYRELMDSHPDVNMTVQLGCLTEWIMMKKFSPLDRVIDLHLPDRICTVCRIPLKKDVGNPQINTENYYSFGNLLSVMAQNAGIPVPTDGPTIHIPYAARQGVAARIPSRRFVCIHCFSNEESRNWDTAKWRELVQILTDTYQLDVVEVGLRPALAGFTNPCYKSLCGQLSILETAEVIRRAAVFIGTDSGPAHLANAVGTYGVILLGCYREFKRYMPYSGAYQSEKNAEILHHDGFVREVSTTRVLGALVKRFGKDLSDLRMGAN